MEQKEREEYEQMVLTPIQKLIPRLAVPTTISMLVSMIYNLVDAFFVGWLGTSAAAAIGILMSIQAIFQAIGFMFGHGSGTIIAARLGNGDTHTADRFLSTAFICSCIVSVIPAVLGLIFLAPLMRLLGSTETILPYAENYGTYILICGPALTMSCVLNNVMRYEGKAFYAMIGLVSGGVLNMIGDPILMFGFHLGISGAGLSTALSQYISLGILMWMFFSGKTLSRIRPSVIGVHHGKGRQLSLIWSDIRHIVRNGFPSLVRQVLNSVSTAALNIGASPYGDAAIAAMTIVGRIIMFIASVMVGIGQGMQPVTAYNNGAHKYARLRQSFHFTLRLGESLLCILAVIGWIFAGPLVTLFRNDPDVIRIGIVALRLQCIALLFQPLGVVSNMFFQSTGHAKIASFLASLRTGLCYIPAILILPHFIGILGIESAQLVSDILTFVICLPFDITFFRKLPAEDERTAEDERYEAVVK